jgi:hypothetical protein
MVRASGQLARGLAEHAADGRSSLASIQVTGHEIALAAPSVPAVVGQEDAFDRLGGRRQRAGVVVAAPTVRALPACVAAVELCTSRAAGTVRRSAADGTPPRLDDIVRKAGERAVDAWHGKSMPKGCHSRHAEEPSHTGDRGGEPYRTMEEIAGQTASERPSKPRNPRGRSSSFALILNRLSGGIRWRSGRRSAVAVRRFVTSRRPSLGAARRFVMSPRPLLGAVRRFTTNTPRRFQRLRRFVMSPRPSLGAVRRFTTTRRAASTGETIHDVDEATRPARVGRHACVTAAGRSLDRHSKPVPPVATPLTRWPR